MLLLLWAGIIFLFMHSVESQGGGETPQMLAQVSARLGEEVEVSCKLPDGSHTWMVTWYREHRGRSLLHKVEQSLKYSIDAGPKDGGQGQRLVIRDAQRSDSGVYYCAAHIRENLQLTSGARVIVTDASWQGLSVLAPPFAEGAQLDQSVPLLCLVFGANPAWASVSWNIGGDSSQEQKDVEVIDGEGGFSMGSLKLVPREGWTPETAYSCSVPESRNLSGAVPTLRGNCFHTFYYRLPCILLLLLVPPLTLLFRKRLATA